MDENSINKEGEKVNNLKDELTDENSENNPEVIVIDGRGYENVSQTKKEIYTLVDVIEDNQTGDKLYEDIIKLTEKIVEGVTRKMVPEIAERIIREEIEKLKKSSDTEQ